MTRRALVCLVCLVGLMCLPLVLTGCTTSGKGSAGTISSPPSSASSSGTDTGTGTAAPTGTTAAASTTAPTTPATSTPGSLLKGACSFTQLAVRVIPGGAASGQEIALITFTNVSTTSCTLYGYPGVSLRLNGQLIGTPATRTADTLPTPKLVRLAQGEQAQAMLTDFSSCQAPLSDTVRVYPPNSTQFADRPAQLRACHLEIAAVTHS